MLPLPLELTKPVLLAGDLDTQFRTDASNYDPKTQLCWGGGGGCGCGHGSSSNQESETSSGLLVIDLSVDIQVDDNNF